MPGLVDTHSHIGGPAGGDGTAPINPDCRVIDAINVRDTGLKKARAGGITTVNVMPGSGHLLSGQTVYLKLRDGGTIDDLIIRNPDGSAAGGMKMANGTNSIKSRRRSPARAQVGRPRPRAIRQGDRIPRQGEARRRRPREAAAAGPGDGGADRGARRQAGRPLPLPPPRRHPDRPAAAEGVRLPARPAPRQRGVEDRRPDRRGEGAVQRHRRSTRPAASPRPRT